MMLTTAKRRKNNTEKDAEKMKEDWGQTEWTIHLGIFVDRESTIKKLLVEMVGRRTRKRRMIEKNGPHGKRKGKS